MSPFRSSVRFLAGASMALALLVSPLAAQEFTESHLKAAQAAIDATHASDQFNTILIDLSDQTKALFQRSNPGVVQDINKVVDEVAISLASRRPELEQELRRIWAARLTEDELNQVTAFFTSDVGKKFGDSQPLIFRDSIEAAKIWRETVSTEIVTKSRDELAKLGHKF